MGLDLRMDHTLTVPAPITLAALMTIMPAAHDLARLYLRPLNDAMQEYAITTTARAAAFLAQIAHESGQLRHAREIWGPTPAQLAYEGRADLGNTQPGDGRRFMGRGLIQITGRANYRACSLDLFGDEGILLEQPELLETPLHASRSAAWFWVNRGLNPLADAGDFRAITRRINGGYSGWQDRTAYHARARAVLGLWNGP